MTTFVVHYQTPRGLPFYTKIEAETPQEARSKFNKLPGEKCKVTRVKVCRESLRKGVDTPKTEE